MYGTLVGLLNANNSDFGEEVVMKTCTYLHAALTDMKEKNVLLFMLHYSMLTLLSIGQIFVKIPFRTRKCKRDTTHFYSNAA